MTRRAIFFSVALLLAASGASAQGKPKSVRDELPTAARVNWDNARELYDAQNWAAAMGEYQRAYEVSHNPRVLFNVGVCEKNLGHYLRASAAFRKELAEAGKKVPANELAAIHSALGTLEPLISTLVVATNEPGATLTIDKEPQPGVSPFAQPIAIDVGVHTLRLTKPGFTDAVLENLTVVSGEVAQAKLTLTPLEPKGHAHIEVTGPSRAAVYIDGKDMGNAPFDGDVDTGAHVVEARADDYVTVRQPLSVKYREAASLTLTLSPRRHEGFLRIAALPDGAIIEIDGKRVGVSHWEGPLTSKDGHEVVIKKDGYYTQTQELVLADDQERTLPVSLNPEKTWIWWTLGAVAVVGSGIALGYLVFHNSLDPVPGSLAAGSAGYGATSFHF
jgi:hypothetical protein